MLQHLARSLTASLVLIDSHCSVRDVHIQAFKDQVRPIALHHTPHLDGQLTIFQIHYSASCLKVRVGGAYLVCLVSNKTEEDKNVSSECFVFDTVHTK